MAADFQTIGVVSNMKLPDWLHEALPYAYAASGALTLMMFENLPGNLAGGTLVAAGVITWHMRQRYRRAKQLRPTRAEAVRTNILESTAGSYYNDPG
jgi:hypothetical protein